MMSRFLTILACGLILSACSQQETISSDGAVRNESVKEGSAITSDPGLENGLSNDVLFEMADAHARAVLLMSPEASTQLAVDEAFLRAKYSDRLGDYTQAAADQARDLNARLLRELSAVDRGQLTDLAAVTYDVLMTSYQLADDFKEVAIGGNYSPVGGVRPYIVTQMYGPHVSLPRLLQVSHSVKTKDEADDYIARMYELGRALTETADLIRLDAEKGMAPPDFAITGALRSVRAFSAAAPEDNPLVTTFTEKVAAIEGLDEADGEAFATAAVSAMIDAVIPAYQALAAALEATLPQTNSDPGLWRLQNGERYYELALRRYGAAGKSADDVHEIGLAEVERITAEMNEILVAQGFSEGSVAERFIALSENPQHLYPNTDEGRAQLLSDLNARIADLEPWLPTAFASRPTQPVEVRRIPAYEQDGSAGGFYTGPPLDGSRPGIFWINLKNTSDWPKFTLPTLTYHEAAPGHHFQIALERSIEGMPLMRNLTRFSQFAEGWALYTEKLVSEAGIYDDDPLGDLGRLQAEQFRAARLVVDTGLHHKRWTRDQAIKYMREVTGDPLPSVIREVERYAVMPGQATSYKLGMLKMLELRDRAKRELGASFDQRAFHDAVLLDGARPLNVLEAGIDRWIAETKAG